jgi:hypothetical protein
MERKAFDETYQINGEYSAVKFGDDWYLHSSRRAAYEPPRL